MRKGLLAALLGVPALGIGLAVAFLPSPGSGSAAPRGIFSAHLASVQREKRLAAAEELRGFLRDTSIGEEGIRALNPKLIPAGLRITAKGEVELIPDDEWKEQMIEYHRTHRPPEPPQRPSLSPTITKVALVTYGEEEEYEDQKSAHELRVEEREGEIRRFLFSSFRSSLNRVDEYGRRRTMFNDYIKDTVEHYKDQRHGGNYEDVDRGDWER